MSFDEPRTSESTMENTTEDQPVAVWVAPDFDEASACAEICAYVFAE